VNVKLRAHTKSTDEITLSWVLSGYDSQNRLTAQLVRCESRFGPYEPVGEPFDPRSRDTLVDVVGQYRILRRWYYRLRITEYTNSAEVTQEWPPYDGASTDRRDDPEAMLLASDSEVRYRDHGQSVIYFPVRTSGERCPKCFDRVTSAQISANCAACWGTSFTGGFLQPVKVWIMLEHQKATPSQENVQGVPITTVHTQARFPWFVDLKPNDVVVDEDNRRWSVTENIHRVMKRGCLIRSECEMALLPLDNVEYQLPVPDQIAEKQRGWRYTPDFLR